MIMSHPMKILWDAAIDTEMFILWWSGGKDKKQCRCSTRWWCCGFTKVLPTVVNKFFWQGYYWTFILARYISNVSPAVLCHLGLWAMTCSDVERKLLPAPQSKTHREECLVLQRQLLRGLGIILTFWMLCTAVLCACHQFQCMGQVLWNGLVLVLWPLQTLVCHVWVVC